MTYTIWRVSPEGDEFRITTAGVTSVRDRALAKVRTFNERLIRSEPGTADRYIVRDATGREIGVPVEA